MIEFRAEHFSLDFENEKKWYPAVTDFKDNVENNQKDNYINEKEKEQSYCCGKENRNSSCCS